ncbi:hypothetical protein H0H93_007553, partial [Arthromyces matolae]
VGGPETVVKSLKSTKIGGQVHVIKAIAKGCTELATDVLVQVVWRCASLRGIQIGSRAQFVDMNKMLEANPESTRPYIDRVFPFEEAREAYRYFESQAHVGKVVIKVAKQ